MIWPAWLLGRLQLWKAWQEASREDERRTKAMILRRLNELQQQINVPRK